jgi:hypothetical protein
LYGHLLRNSAGHAQTDANDDKKSTELFLKGSRSVLSLGRFKGNPLTRPIHWL